MINELEISELSLEVAKRLRAEAELLARPEVLKEVTALIEAAEDARAASDAAVRLAREERETADRKLAGLAKAGKDHAEWLARTEREWRRRDSDLREGEQRHAVAAAHLNDRENALADRVAEHERELARLRAHVGRAA
jgi:hypothetical protein